MTMLAVNAAVLVAVFGAAWLACLAIRDLTPVDSLWAFGMVVLAISSFVQSDGGMASQRAILLLGLCTLWGLRLGVYMLWRWRDHGPDRRYIRMMEKAQAQRGWGFARASLLLVFATQAPLLFIVALPVQLGQVDAGPAIGIVGWAGVALALFGIVFETLGDAQLTRFRRDPANAGKVMQSGLWRYTRHPNYFGDACVWWGLYLLAAETATGVWALPGPLLLTWTLLKWSGAPTVEGRLHKTRPGYADYVRRTSGFIPLPPRG